jgi:hypothetical protein
MSKKITNSANFIDLRDVIARFEELENERQEIIDAIKDGTSTRFNLAQHDESDEGMEFFALKQLLDDCEGNGGDEQWRGDWYPIELIRCTYFKEYAQELAEGCGMIQRDLKWPYTCIDWDSAARELLMDYTTISFNGVNYHCR